MKHFHWYHVSMDWNQETLLVKPRIGRVDDENDINDQTPFIAVCPTFQQCIVAIGDFHCAWRLRVYRTTGKKPAVPADWVFDYQVTKEHRLYSQARFEHVGTLLYEDFPVIPRRITNYNNIKHLEKVLILFNKANIAAKFRSFDESFSLTTC